MDHDPVYQLSLALSGFHRAKLRCERHGNNADVVDMFIDLTEALWWACSVDEGISSLVGAADYVAARDSDWQGAHILGIRCARNSAGHERALTVVTSGGVKVSDEGLTMPVRVSPQQVVWRAFGDLPFGKQQARAAMLAYEQYLAGKLALQTLSAAAGWFASAQSRWPEQWGIKVIRPTPD